MQGVWRVQGLRVFGWGFGGWGGTSLSVLFGSCRASKKSLSGLCKGSYDKFTLAFAGAYERFIFGAR